MRAEEPLNPSDLFRELKRRRVFRVAVVYAIVAWILVQVSATAFPHLALPDWTITLVIALAVVAFPIALILAWAFELTPEGVKRTEPAPPGPTPSAAGQEGSTSRRARRMALYGSVAAIAGAGALFAFSVLRSEPEPRPTEAVEAVDPALNRGIAVLPFTNMSPDREQEYFSDGITEDLLTNLSRIEGLRVISRTSVMRYKGTDQPVPEIARQLGVGYVVEGSVRRDGNQVRVSAQLIDAARDAHLWAETYDRELTGIFQIQSDIAQRIAEALQRRLTPAERTRIADGGTERVTAYDLLLRGREYLNRPGEADLTKYPLAKDFFRRALEIDPHYARAYAGLSEAFRRNIGLPMRVRQDSTLVFARRALELDPDLAEAAAAFGFGYLLADERARAEAEFRRALALDPNQADATEGLAHLAALNGRLDEAVRWQRRAVEVDPLSPARLYIKGRYLFDLGDLARTETAFRRAVSLAPDQPDASYLLASVHLIRGEAEQAEARMRAMLAAASDQPQAQAAMGRFLADVGRYEDADAYLERFPHPLGAIAIWRAAIARQMGQEDRVAELLLSPDEYLRIWEREGIPPPPRALLYIHALWRDHDAMLEVLREHWRSGLRSSIDDPPHIGLYWIDREDVVAELRDDPRFRAWLAEVRAEFDAMRARLLAQAGP